MPREIDHGWAAFNIEGDGNQFDFDVALGATVSGLREPDSTVVVLHSLDASAPFRVSIQGSLRLRGQNRLAAGQLEVFSPMLTEDQVELDNASECVLQLTRSLMLYRPISFDIVEWHRKSTRAVTFPSSESTYKLRGNELRRFLTFSRRLMSLHVSRNLFDHARYLPSDFDDDVRSLLGGSRADERHVLETEAFLMIAVSLLEDARRQWNAAREHQLMLLMMAAEALFGDDDKAELAFRLSLRMAVLNGSDDSDRRRLFEAVKASYDKRSKLVHGSLYQRKKGFLLVSDEDLGILRNLVRASILYFVALKEQGKTALLQTLDRAIFDRREIDQLRAKANAYWGLEGFDERIHSAAWTMTT